MCHLRASPSQAAAGRGHGECWPTPLADDGGSPGQGTSARPVSGKPMLAPLGATGGGAATARASSAKAAAAAGSGGGAAAGGTALPARRAVERPPTPDLPPPAAATAAGHAALVLLQRLLRGRAAQNIMCVRARARWEGKGGIMKLREVAAAGRAVAGLWRLAACGCAAC
jgi:hypothetical protein